MGRIGPLELLFFFVVIVGVFAAVFASGYAVGRASGKAEALRERNGR